MLGRARMEGEEGGREERPGKVIGEGEEGGADGRGVRGQRP